MTPKTRCPVCDRPFVPVRHQRYDTPVCRKQAYFNRERERIREEIRKELAS